MDRDSEGLGYGTTVRWNGRDVRAWVPAPLTLQEQELSVITVRLTERAAAQVLRAGQRLPADWEPLARLLLRAEGVASSEIEGLRAPLEEVAAAELGRPEGGAATWVADNLGVVAEALDAAQAAPLSIQLLHGWHRRLMRHDERLPEAWVGDFRGALGWVGGPTPLMAAYVPPPPEMIPGLMGDLVAYVNRQDVDPITQAAVAHAQFETIHPYADGNGRIGRVLVGWLLARRLGVEVPSPVSVFMARDRGGYLAGLTLYRAGRIDQWVAWFAEVVARSSLAMIELVDQVTRLLERLALRLTDTRADAASHRLLRLLPGLPLLSSALVAERLGISERAARSALQLLAEVGILVPTDLARHGRGRPAQWWMATEVVELIRSMGG